ncbi:MAG TPA: hypothetical protein VFQ53_42200 [Kofleriaceae bacterium]|nr:hypothetical protein [Kofleriaceae bacterium]
MRKLGALVLCVVAGSAPAWGKGDKPAKGDDDEEAADDESSSSDEEEEAPDEDAAEKPKKGKSDTAPEGEEASEQADDFKKQDLTGHADVEGGKKENVFEKDRFFVDKLDTDKTEKGTLVQGSLTSTSFGYRESGGTIAPNDAGVPSASQFTRLFTDLRLQTDFRHIAGGRWEARVDVRGRFVADPGNTTPGYTPPNNSSSQSGFLGENELEVRELWIIRSGKRSDLFFGRQFVPDLAGVKFDGLRIDYASSEKITFLGFGGLYPIRGSRSITTDYEPLLSNPDPDDGTRASAGRFTGAGGFGLAYRTQNAYGAVGGVALVPLQSEAPRIFGTATGYWRAGPKVDFYHFLVLDVVGSNAVNAGLTNLSAGANFKPDQRLRATLSVNRVDTETLNVQAQAFLADPEKNINIIQNEAFLIRVAQNQARASLSAGLGSLQRFEITVASAFRYRGEITLTAPVDMAPQTVTLPPGKSVEVYGGITDRRSIADLRIGVDGAKIFKVGGDAYQRTQSTSFRGFLARELAEGRGEWEAEVAYATTEDDKAGAICLDVVSCYGAAKSSTISLGGQAFYRLNRDWFGMAGLFVNRQNIKSFQSTMVMEDPPITGLSGFLRIAYRF